MIPLQILNQTTTYTIDQQGNIFNLKTKKFLKGSIKNGYKTVKLTVNNTKKDYLVHRLVAETFLPNPEILPQVNHIDGNRLNNDISNLEWASASDNIKHSWEKIGRKKRQQICPINEEIQNLPSWKRYKNTNYWFSKDGRGANLKTGKYLNPVMTPEGYLRFNLYFNKVSTTIMAHKLIYLVFHPEEVLLANEQINHIDGNKLNNNINNLEKITRTENMLHSYYQLNQNVVQILQCDKNNNIIAEYPSMSEAARQNGFAVSGISLAVNGKLKTYKGFVWKQV